VRVRMCECVRGTQRILSCTPELAAARRQKSVVRVLEVVRFFGNQSLPRGFEKKRSI